MDPTTSTFTMALLLSAALSYPARQLPEGVCQLPPDSGLCRARMPRFFYNPSRGECQSFNYGGCGGNDNRFTYREDCNQACLPDFPSSDAECNLPKVTGGPCRAYIPSYFYDPRTGQCAFFVYSGCKGNANRFSSEEKCQKKCILSGGDLDPVCREPMMPGKCRGNIPRWFFDVDTKSCQQFAYGGCGGNGNNFRSEAACGLMCSPH